jgi:hypothetical protein
MIDSHFRNLPNLSHIPRLGQRHYWLQDLTCSASDTQSFTQHDALQNSMSTSRPCFTIRHRSHDSEVRSKSMCAHIIHAKRYTTLRPLELYRSCLTLVISSSESFALLWSRTRTATLTTSIETTSNSMHHTPACGADFPIHIRQAKVSQAREHVKCDVAV